MDPWVGVIEQSGEPRVARGAATIGRLPQTEEGTNDRVFAEGVESLERVRDLCRVSGWQDCRSRT